MKYQKDFIDGLVLTRRATDEFAKKLVPISKNPSKTENFEKELSMTDKIRKLLGLQLI